MARGESRSFADDTSGRVRLVVSVIALIASVIVLLLIANNKIGFYVVPTSSMEPTLHPNDRIVAVAASQYDRGQVVVVRDPERKGEYLVKRIVALPGDRIEIFNSRLMVNGSPVNEPYLREAMTYQLPPSDVPGGEVFLLGDNRNESEDSHLWKRGLSQSDIVGAVKYIYSPGDRRGARVSYPEVFRDVARAKDASRGTATDGQRSP